MVSARAGTLFQGLLLTQLFGMKSRVKTHGHKFVFGEEEGDFFSARKTKCLRMLKKNPPELCVVL